MQRVDEPFDIDLALLPIGDCFTMGPEGAVKAAKMLKPKSLPLHHNTFPYIQVDPDVWLDLMGEAGLEAQVLASGETLEV
ncbi:MAG: hypothetical protein ACR2GR_08765 [Rhodothermales bacterium]